MFLAVIIETFFEQKWEVKYRSKQVLIIKSSEVCLFSWKLFLEYFQHGLSLLSNHTGIIHDVRHNDKRGIH